MSESTINVAPLQSIIDGLTAMLQAQLLAQMEDIAAMRPRLLQAVQATVDQISQDNWKIKSEIDKLARDIANDLIIPHIQELKQDKSFQESLKEKVRVALLDTAAKQAASIKIDIRGGY